MRGSSILAVFFAALLATSVHADEMSLLSGFYRTQDDTPGFKQRTLQLGGRYGFAPAKDKHFWFFDAGVSSTSYSGDGAPDGASGLRIGLGQKYFFHNLGEFVHTFLAWSAGYRNESSADRTTKTKASGLYYAGNGGFRFDFSKSIFMDVEAEFFNSSLMSSVKTTTTATGATAETKTTQLQADTFSGVDSLRFGVGLVF